MKYSGELPITGAKASTTVSRDSKYTYLKYLWLFLEYTRDKVGADLPC